MSIPKEPRQQMINIMYLVLIALLALSVSAEILNAFKVVNRGISNSNYAINDQITATLAAFEDKVNKNNDPQDLRYFQAAQNAGDITDEFIQYLDELDELLRTESGVDPLTGELTKSEDQDTPSRIMLGNDKDGKAYELEQKILDYRQKYIDLFRKNNGDSKADVAYLQKAMPLNAPLPPEDSDKDDWATYNFFQMPVAAATTLLNQFRNDAIASEAMVVQRFSEKVGGIQKKISFDKMKAIAIPSSKNVSEGDPFSLEVFLAATSLKERPNIIVGGQSMALKPDGSAEYRTVAQGLGRKTVSGSIAVADGEGGVKNIPFSTSYVVKPRPPKKDPQLEITDLRKKIQDYENKIKQSQQQIRSLEASQKNPNQELARLREQLKDLNKLKAQLKDMDKLKQDLAQMEDLKKKAQEVNQLRRQVESLQAKTAVKTEDLRPQLTDALNKLKRAEKQLKDLQQKAPKEDLRPKLAELQNKLRDMNQLQNKLKDAEQRLKAMQSKAKPEDLRPKLAQTEDKLRQAERRIQDLQNKIPKNDPRKAIDDLKNKLARADQEIKRLQNQKTPEDPRLKELLSENRRLKSNQKDIRQIQQMEQKIKQLENEKKNTPKPQNNQAQIQKLQREIERLKKELKPVGVVSADKMNVFYIGVPNPITVSVSGVSQRDVKATITTGNMSPAGAGQYLVQVPPPAGKRTNVNLTVGGRVIDRKEFRIKRIPDPIPEVGGKAGGVLGTGEMKAQRGLIARLKDFDFDARFEVLGFELTLAERGQDLLIVSNKGARFNDKSKNLLNKAKVGSIYYFDNIKVRGPDKATRKLPSISFKIR